MGQITVRKIDDALLRRLKVQAAENGRSMEAEVREILGRALEQPETPSFKQWLLAMPDVGEDADFARIDGDFRELEL